MVRRALAAAMMVAMVLTTAPVSLFAAGRAQTGGASIAGTATGNSGQTLANYTVQLRNVTTGQLMGTTTSSATGGFSFAGLEAGQYVVEVVNAAGQIIGTSAAITAAAGATITGVAVAATAAGAIAGGAAAAGGLGALFGSTAAIVTITAVTAGVVAGVVVLNNNASPSR